MLRPRGQEFIKCRLARFATHGKKMMKGELPIEIKILVPSLTVHSRENAHSLTALVFRSSRSNRCSGGSEQVKSFRCKAAMRLQTC